jgi:hypothetical protein
VRPRHDCFEHLAVAILAAFFEQEKNREDREQKRNDIGVR